MGIVEISLNAKLSSAAIVVIVAVLIRVFR